MSRGRSVLRHPVQFAIACAVLFWSLLAVVISGSRLVSVYLSKSDFSVISSYEKCEQPYNNRCERHYTIRDQVTGDERDLVPFGGQFPISPLPDDVHILKRGYSFVYEVSGEREEWPSLGFYSFVLMCGLLVSVGWFYLGGISFVKRCIERDE